MRRLVAISVLSTILACGSRQRDVVRPASASASAHDSIDSRESLGAANAGKTRVVATADPPCEANGEAACVDACKTGDAVACASFAGALIGGVRVAEDYPRARLLAERSCVAGVARGCTALAVLYANGFGVAADVPVAVATYRRMCDLGEKYACANIANAEAYGTLGVKEDDEQALIDSERGCESGAGNACTTAGTLRMRPGGAHDSILGARRFQRACRLNDFGGCAGLGICYELGEGVEKDLARAAALTQRACDGNIGAGCKGLGDIESDADGVSPDFTRGAESYRRACALNFPGGCAMLAESLLNDHATPQDRARAIELLHVACRANDERACRRLDSLGEAR